MARPYTTTASEVAPSAAVGVAVTPNASAWVNSAWVEIDASTDEAWVLKGVSAKCATDTTFIIEVGVGGDGSEAAVAAVSGHFSPGLGITPTMDLMMPIPVDLVPIGSRVSVRLRKSGTDTTDWAIRVLYLPKPVAGHVVATTKPLRCTAVAGVPAGGGSWANGAWTELLAASGGAVTIVGVTVGTQVNAAWGEIDIGTGAAASEVVKATQSWLDDAYFWGSSRPPYYFVPGLTISAGVVRIAARMRIDVASASAINVILWYHEDLESEVLAARCTSQAQQVTTPAAAAVAVTRSAVGGPYTWVTLVANTATAIALGSVTVLMSSGGAGRLIFGTGTAGNEAILNAAPVLFAGGHTSSNAVDGRHQWTVPYAIVVPAGVRLAVAYESASAENIQGVKAQYFASPDEESLAVSGEHYEFESAAVTPSATPWSNSATVEVNSGVGEVIAWAIYGVVALGIQGQIQAEIDVLVDGAVAATVAGVTSDAACVLLNTPLRVPAQTAVSVRLRKEGTDVNGWTIYLLRYGGDPIDPSTLPATVPAYPTGYRLLKRVDLGHVDTAGAAETTSYSGHPIWDAEGKLALPKVVSLGFFERACSGLYGDIPIDSARVLFADLPDLRTELMQFRGWLDHAEQYGVLSIIGSIWMISEADWRAQRAWFPVFTGPVARYGLGGDFTFSLDLKAWFERILTDPFPLRTLGEDFAGAPLATRDLYGQLVVGRHSDEASATAAPTPATETASGTHQDGGSGDWIAGYGPGPGTAPASLASAENTSAGNLDTGVWPSDDVVVMVCELDAGVPSEPSPRVPGDEAATITMNGSAVTATCAGTGTFRFFFGYRAVNRIEWTQYKDTTDPVTGVQCTDMPAPGVTPTTSNITAGFTPVATTDIWYGQRVAKMPDGLTAASVEFLAINSPFLRMRRLVTAAVAGAEAYYDYWHLPGQPAAFRYLVPAGQVNGAGDVYGDSDMTFAAAQKVSGTPTPMGRVKGEVIGTFTSLDGVSMIGVSFAAHAIDPDDFQGMYFRQSDGTVTPVDGVGGNPGFGTNIFAPGQLNFTTKWGATPYRAGLTGQRHFVCYLLGVWGDRVNGTQDPADAVGEVDVYINVAAGVESVGDASGAGITDGYVQAAWLLDNYTLPETAHSLAGGGDWAAAVPTWPDGRVKRDAASFATTAAEAAVDIPAGPARGFIIKTPETMGAILKRIIQGLDAQLYQNVNGAFALALLPPTSSEDDGTIVDHINDVGESLETEDDEQELFNVLPYSLDYDFAAGSYREVPAPVEDAASIVKYRRRTAPSGTFDLWTVQSSTIAAQILDRARQRHRKPPRLVVYERDISGIALDLATRYLLTHPMGATASGYAQRRMQVQKIRLSLDADRMQVWSRDRDWIGRDLTTVESEEYMASRWGGGSRHDSCVTVSARVKPFNWQQIRINWATWQTGVPLIARVLVGTDAGTVTPYVAAASDLGTAVATGTGVTSSTPAYQDVVIYDGVGAKPTGTPDYELILTLAGGATANGTHAAWWIEGRPGEA